ncbi:MAG: MFS transporter [Gaiellaceae bacterium]
MAILGATFMLLVDVTIVQVALPRIQRDLHASFASLQWVIDAYALTLAALMLSSGSLSDRFGRKRVFLGGVAIFSLSSLACGLSTSSLGLDLFRAAQGVGGAAMFATSLALIAQEFSGRQRGLAIALWGSTIGGAVAVGPLLGGALTEGLGWPWIFFVNVPIGIAVVAITVRSIPNVRDESARHSDLGGLVTFSGMLFLLVFGLLRGSDRGWASPLILAAFAGAAALLAAFVLVETRQPRPMFDLSLLRSPAFCGVSLGTLAIGAGMFSLFPFISLYLQNILGYSPFQGGLRLLPATLLSFTVPIAARALGERISPGVMLTTGLAFTAVGLVLMAGSSAHSSWTALLAGLIAAGFGIGLANPSIAQIALTVVPPQRAGMASGISNTFRIGGLATGVAALGALFQHDLRNRLQELVPGAGPKLAGAVASGGTRAAQAMVAPASRPHVAAAARSAFVSGLDLAFLTGAGTVAAGCLLVALLVRPRSLQEAASGAQRQAPADEPAQG